MRHLALLTLLALLSPALADAGTAGAALTRSAEGDPDAPVTAISMPNGMVTSTSWRLFSRAPRTTSTCPFPLRRWFGIAMVRLPDRNCPVGLALHASTSASVPCTTTFPPCTPGPGPISMT